MLFGFKRAYCGMAMEKEELDVCGVCVLPLLCIMAPHGITCRSPRRKTPAVWSLGMARARDPPLTEVAPHSLLGASLILSSFSNDAISFLISPYQVFWLSAHLYLIEVSKSLINLTEKDSEGDIPCPPFFVPKCHMTVSNLYQTFCVVDDQLR